MAQVNLGRVVGYSAYEVAVQEGFVGTEQEWLASLKGDTGNTGPTGADGDDGTTFTPSVSAEGIISWTNDGGKPNPTSVNIKGPQGIQGPQGPTGPAGTYTEGTGIDIDNGVLSVDTTVVALKSDLGDELPPIASGDAGKVLKVNAGETAVEWANDASQTYTAGTGIDITSNVISSTVNGVPSASGASEGDVLTVDSRGEINWAAPSGGGSYSAGEGIAIDENDEISVDYANLDGFKIGNLVDNAWGFGKQNYMVWDGELDANCEATSNDNIYEFNFSGCEDDIIGDIGPDTITLGWSGSEEVGANTVYTWTDDYNTLTATYVTGTTNFVSMNLAADSNTYQEGDTFEFRFEVINEIPAEFLPAPELPEIQSGDAGKALVVNSLEDGVEWATVGGGSGVEYKYIYLNNFQSMDQTSKDNLTYFINHRGQDACYIIKGQYGVNYQLTRVDTTNTRFVFTSLGTTGQYSDTYQYNTATVYYSGSLGEATLIGVDLTYYNSIIPTKAGTNITIANDGTISAAGGGATYTAGTGISISNANVISADSQYPSFTNNAGKILAVNSQASGVEWINQGRAMPGDPANDGDYKLVNTVDNGMSVLSWETDSGGGSVSDPIRFETSHQSGEPFNFAVFGTNQIEIGDEASDGGQNSAVLTNSGMNLYTALSSSGSIQISDEPLQDGESYEGRLYIDCNGGGVIVNGLRLYDNQTGDLYCITVENGVLTATLWEDPTEPPVE